MVLAVNAPSVAAAPHAGSLDRSFGRNGRLVFNLPGERMRPRAMVVQPDGRIVVAGHLTDSADAYSTSGRALVLRFLPDGGLDTAFGDGGVARVRLRAPVAIAAVAIQPDGALLLGGRAFGGPGENLGAVARLLPSGAVDESFGSGGLATMRAENVHSYTADSPVLSHLGVQPDGRIVAAGTQRAYDVHRSADPFLVRLLPNGAPDESFDRNGTARAGPTHPSAVLTHPDGHMVVTGSDEDYFGPGALSALRIGIGTAEFPLGQNPADAYATYWYSRPLTGLGAEVLGDGSILVAGGLAGSLSQREFLAWARLGPRLELLAKGRTRSAAAQAVTFDSRGALLTAGHPANFGAPLLELQRFRGRRLYRDRSFGDRTGTAFVQIKDPAELIGLDMQRDTLIVGGYTRAGLSPDEPLTLFRLNARQDGAGPIITIRGLPPRRCLSTPTPARIRARDESRVLTRVRIDRRPVARSHRHRMRVVVDPTELKPGRHVLTVSATDAAGNLGRRGAPFRVCRPKSPA
jgi:uncharacterized delta-60 repeat protein